MYLLVFIGTGSAATLPEDQDASIALPPSLFMRISGSEVGIVFTFYETATLFPLPDETCNNLTVGSAVIGALVAGHSFTDLRDPVIILLRLINQVCYFNVQNYYHHHIQSDFSIVYIGECYKSKMCKLELYSCR